MAIKRLFGVAGIVVAGSMLTGCWPCCRSEGGSKTTLPTPPPVRTPNPRAETGSLTQPGGWSNQPRTQDSSLAIPASPVQQPATGARTNVPPVSGLTPAGGNSLDTGSAAAANPVRQASGTTTTIDPLMPDRSSSAGSPGMPQRDTGTPTTTLTAPLPPGPPPPSAGSVPLPPSSQTPAKTTSATSNYMTVPPPERVPGQAPIPTLAPQGASPVE